MVPGRLRSFARLESKDMGVPMLEGRNTEIHPELCMSSPVDNDNSSSKSYLYAIPIRHYLHRQPYFVSCELEGIIRTPGILVGLNERSQSAYAAPAPKPVDRAIGQARPVRAEVRIVDYDETPRECDARLKRMTEAMTPTLKPTPLWWMSNQCQHSSRITTIGNGRDVRLDYEIRHYPSSRD